MLDAYEIQDIDSNPLYLHVALDCNAEQQQIVFSLYNALFASEEGVPNLQAMLRRVWVVASPGSVVGYSALWFM